MVRKLIQSALSLALCPLLAAQQAALPAAHPEGALPDPHEATPQAAKVLPEFVTVPPGTAIKCRLADAVSSATAKRGQTIRLVVAQDVELSGVRVLAAGAAARAKIDKATAAVPGQRIGALEFSLQELRIGGHTRLPLGTTIPGPPMTAKEKWQIAGYTTGGIVLSPLLLAGYAVALILDGAFLLGDHGSSRGVVHKPTGVDVVLDAGTEQTYYTQMAVTIRVSDLQAAQASAGTLPETTR